MDLFVRPEAEADLRSAYQWYEEQSHGLGDHFIGEVDAVFARVANMPAQFPVVHRDLRRALIKRFPYAVFFLEGEERIVVVAVLNQASDPGRWKDRSRQD